MVLKVAILPLILYGIRSRTIEQYEHPYSFVSSYFVSNFYLVFFPTIACIHVYYYNSSSVYMNACKNYGLYVQLLTGTLDVLYFP